MFDTSKKLRSKHNLGLNMTYIECEHMSNVFNRIFFVSTNRLDGWGQNEDNQNKIKIIILQFLDISFSHSKKKK